MVSAVKVNNVCTENGSGGYPTGNPVRASSWSDSTPISFLQDLQAILRAGIVPLVLLLRKWKPGVLEIVHFQGVVAILGAAAFIAARLDLLGCRAALSIRG